MSIDILAEIEETKIELTQLNDTINNYKTKLIQLNDIINNCKEWDDYAISLQNEYDHWLHRYNKLIEEGK